MNELPEKCDNPKYNGKNLTNRVLMEESVDNVGQKRVTYYCPAYLRLQIQNFSAMNFQELSASINTVLLLTVNFRGLCTSLEEKIRPLLKLGFNREDSIQIKESSKSKAISMLAKEGGIYTYTIYKIIHVAMKPDIRWFPLNLVHLIMSVYLKDIQLNDDMLQEVVRDLNMLIEKKWMDVLEMEKDADKDPSQIKQVIRYINELKKQKEEMEKATTINIKFNFMETDLQYLKMTPPAEDSFGYYRLAKAKMNVQFTNIPSSKRLRPKLKIVSKKQKSESLHSNQKQIDHSKIKPFNYAHFEMPVYQVPDVTIITIFFPLWLLAILTLGIYFQDNGLHDRILSLSTLMIAFVSLIRVLREQLPQSPHITLVQYLVYAQILTGILCFGESISIRNLNEYTFIWTENGYYLVSFVITCGEIAVIILLWLIHTFNRVPRYNNIIFKKTDADFRYQKWFNLNCDKHFRRKIDNFRIRVLDVNRNLETFKMTENRIKEEEEQHNKKFAAVENSLAEYINTSPLYKEVMQE